MSETGTLLAESLSRLLDGVSAQPATGPAWVDPSERFQAAIEDAGLPLALVDEKSGGYGCSFTDVASLPRLIGALAASYPIVEVLLAASVSAKLGLDIRPGEATTTASPGLRGRQSGDGVAFFGSGIDAAFWPQAKRLLVPFTGEDDGKALIAVVDTAGLPPERNLMSQARLRLADGGTFRATVHPAPPGCAPYELAARGAALTAAGMVGTLEAVLELMIDYANTRAQFGRTIGKFQAIQILVARSAGETAASDAALSNALFALDQARPDAIEPFVAKARAGLAASYVAAAAHQLFGAVAFTEQHRLHHLTKRLWAWRDEWGRQSFCEAEIGRRAIAAGGDRLWPMLVDEPTAA